MHAISDEFLKHFEEVDDPRTDNSNRRHELSDMLILTILALISVRTVNLTPLALAFESTVQSESVYQRVKRFFRHHVFETDQIVGYTLAGFR